MKYLLIKKKKNIFKAGEFKIHISQKLLKITVTDFCLELRILTVAFVFRRWNFSSLEDLECLVSKAQIILSWSFEECYLGTY